MIPALTLWGASGESGEGRPYATLSVKILLIVDQISNLLALEDILTDLDAVLIKEASAREALSTMLDHEIDCILVDVSMPDMDGWEFLRMLKHASTQPRIPVIMVSGKIFSENETLKAYQNGAVDFVFKPLDAEVVFRKVDFFVQQARRMKSLEAIEGNIQCLSDEVIRPLRELRDNSAELTTETTNIASIVAAVEALEQAWEAFTHEKVGNDRS